MMVIRMRDMLMMTAEVEYSKIYNKKIIRAKKKHAHEKKHPRVLL